MFSHVVIGIVSGIGGIFVGRASRNGEVKQLTEQIGETDLVFHKEAYVERKQLAAIFKAEKNAEDNKVLKDKMKKDSEIVSNAQEIESKRKAQVAKLTLVKETKKTGTDDKG